MALKKFSMHALCWNKALIIEIKTYDNFAHSFSASMLLSTLTVSFTEIFKNQSEIISSDYYIFVYDVNNTLYSNSSL